MCQQSANIYLLRVIAFHVSWILKFAFGSLELSFNFQVDQVKHFRFKFNCHSWRHLDDSPPNNLPISIASFCSKIKLLQFMKPLAPKQIKPYWKFDLWTQTKGKPESTHLIQVYIISFSLSLVNNHVIYVLSITITSISVTI